ncbi:hypothetical protein ACT6QG_14460 [Xanthobacter sp. TB0136]|uniref:hypothetical protein n=1 Tax=Xanthobacter sp. TB0136 TaxID=3459177 RepID=UPI0040396E87
MIEKVFAVGSRQYIANVLVYEDILTVHWSVFFVTTDGSRFLLADGRALDEETGIWLAAVVANDDGADPFDHLPVA